MPQHAWIISPGAYTDIDLTTLGIQAAPKRVMEYALSDIGRYLLFPGPFKIESRLMGCECDLRPSGWQRFKHLVASRTFLKGKASPHADTVERRLLMARLFVPLPSLQDAILARHLDRLRDLLRPFDPILQEIAGLDLDRVADMRGVCEDAGGHRTHITLSGDLEIKRRYVMDNLLGHIPITLPQAHIAGGLYEMRGLAARTYQEGRRHRLLRFHVNGEFFACLLNAAGRVAFWIEDAKRLHHLLILQQALERDPVLASSIEGCLRGEAQALRLMINAKMDIDYSRNRLPQVYQELFQRLDLKSGVRKKVIRSLNVHQTGVSFSFTRPGGYGDAQAITSIAVLHDVKALDPLRETLPELYAAINLKASHTEAGKYYLLESIKGRPDEERL
jgi:hypothetical protein